jgi:hypothetical protein
MGTRNLNLPSFYLVNGLTLTAVPFMRAISRDSVAKQHLFTRDTLSNGLRSRRGFWLTHCMQSAVLTPPVWHFPRVLPQHTSFIKPVFYSEQLVYGWTRDASTGVWIITPNHECKGGGPAKQDLTLQVLVESRNSAPRPPCHNAFEHALVSVNVMRLLNAGLAGSRTNCQGSRMTTCHCL